jgi:hypothetical protein
LATHWKTNIKIRLKLLFSLFLEIKNLRNRIIFEILIWISLFGEISRVIFKKKGLLLGGFRRWWWPLNVHVIRFSRWVIDDTTTTTTTVMSPITPLELSPDTCEQTKHSRQHSCLPRRSRSSSNIHSCLPSHDVIGSLWRTFSRQFMSPATRFNWSSDTEDLFFLSLSLLSMFDQAPY